MAQLESTEKKITMVSADSHIVEPPNCFVDYIDPQYRSRAPHVIKTAKGGHMFIVEGMDTPFPITSAASAGMDQRSLKFDELPLNAVNKGGWDPEQRLLDQDRDGVSAEIIYPTLGMMICSLDDADYKAACMQAYNRWLQEFVAYSPARLFGLGQTAVRSVSEAIDDLQRIKEMGFKGVMMPGEPCGEEDYHSSKFDPLWRAAVELELPLSFHILTSARSRKELMGLVNAPATVRGPKANTMHALIRMNQDIIGTFIWGGVFERHPELEVVCVEADAGWAPYFKQKLDYYYYKRGDAVKTSLPKPPSAYFDDNLYLTFQDDWVALEMIHRLNPRRLLWANDFPHPDACWPHSQQNFAENARHLSDEAKGWIWAQNTIDLYRLPLQQAVGRA